MIKFETIDWLAVAVLFGVEAAAALLVFCHSSTGSSRASLDAAAWAAWVQALGSVGAIAAATWIASRQSRETLANERRQAAERIDALSTMLYLLRQSVRVLVNVEDERTWYPLQNTPDGRRFQALRDAVMRVPLDQLPSEVAVFAFSVVQGELQVLTRQDERGESLDDSSKGLLRTSLFVETLDRHFVLLREEARRLRQGESPRRVVSGSPRRAS